MPKKKSKRKKVKYKIEKREITSEDVSIKDFADVQDAKEQLKKLSRGHTRKPVICSPSMKQDDLLWFEREDFESETESADDAKIKETGDEVQHHTKPTFTKQKKKEKGKQSDSNNEFSGELTYPLDLWDMIAKYIQPEDVRTFSLICRGTQMVINSSNFWLSFYNRLIPDPEKLPLELRPDRIKCRPGLRPRVIRALFHCYDPLSVRIQPNADTGHNPPDSLLHFTCLSTWCKGVISKGGKKVWIFYFKLNKRTGQKKPRTYTPEWFATVDDVNDNPEENNSVFSVVCMNYIPFPPVIGLVLTEVLTGLSAGMKHQRVKMRFHAHRDDGRYQWESGIQVILDPAREVKVLKWWHPLYPYSMA
ncbi:putative transmembrane protein 183BP isoform X1 [Nematostella vectensis]|uniref:putative transmembrane protein 183BP isoform X1 n=1 Tax=Nematostella vectensis TaxID=45351 RepID=UPI0020774E03|nr:putative transmembrane protein 183BP isoform X1 [Nematostella vectensis]